MFVFTVYSFRRAFAALFLCGVSVLAAQEVEPQRSEPLPGAVDLYNNYLQHNGGRTNLSELTTLVVSGSIVMSGGEPHAFKMTRKQPNKFRYSIDYDHYKTEVISNGKRAWQVLYREDGESEVEEVKGEELLSLQADDGMDGPFLQLAGKYGAIKPVAFEEVRGHDTIRVEIDPSAGIPYHTIWLSLEHFQEVKLAMRSVPDDGTEPIETEMFFTDFEKVVGVYYAKQVDYIVNGESTRMMLIDRIRPNVGVFDSYFDRH